MRLSFRIAVAVATAPIRPLDWEPPYAMGAALEKTKRQEKKKKKTNLSNICGPSTTFPWKFPGEILTFCDQDIVILWYPWGFHGSRSSHGYPNPQVPYIK